MLNDLDFQNPMLSRYASVELNPNYYKVVTLGELISKPETDVVVFDSKWVKVKQSEKGFLFLERKNVNSIAVLLLRDPGEAVQYEMLVRYQPLCTDHKLHACPITGGFDSMDQLPVDLAIQEVLEEAGYTVGYNDVYEFGSYIVGTQTNEVCHLFLCDVTGKTPAEPEGDGSYHESISKNVWEPVTNLYACEYSAMRIYCGLMEELGEFMDMSAASRRQEN